MNIVPNIDVYRSEQLKRVIRQNFFHSTTRSRSGHCFFAPFDFSSYDEEYMRPNKVAETTTAKSDGAAY